MTEKLEIQLFAPLVVGTGFFLAISVVARAANNLNRYTVKGLLASAALLIIAGYLLLWHEEIIAAWGFSPALVLLIGTCFVSVSAWLIVKYWTKIREWNQIPKG
jgi:preprotein translocase subunit SecY